MSRGVEAGIARNTDFGDIPEISIGAETSSLKAEVTDGNVIMKLVPEKTGKYSFRADSGEDTIGWLCDEEGNELISNDDTDEGDDFVFSYLMEEGKTYYLQTRYYDDLQTGSFSVRVDYSLFYVQYEAEVTGGPGEEVVLTVYANTEEGAVLSYQWQDGEGNTIEGAEGAQYTIGELDRDFYAEYRCIVTDDRGNSETAFFEVRFDSGLRAEPVEETEIYVLPGESVTLQVEASTGENSGDLAYAWYCDGQEIEGADADRYTVEHANRAHSYDCKISDAYADSYISFYVFIDTGLVWESELDYEVTLSPGETKTLSVAARNREECGALRYQWRYDDELIEGAQSSELTAAKTGWYSCEVQDDFSSLVTETFVRVDNGLSVSGIESYLTKTVNSGEPFTLSVIASAKTGDLSYQWEYFEDEIEDWKQAGNQAAL